MSRQLENFDLAGHALHVHVLDNFVLFKYLNSYFFAGNIMNAKLDLTKGALTDRLANSVMADGLCFVLAFVPTLIPRLGMMLVFWFFIRRLLFILCDFIIVIYIIRIVCGRCRRVRAIRTLLSLGLVELVRSLLRRDGPERAHQVVGPEALPHCGEALVIGVGRGHAELRERIFLLLLIIKGFLVLRIIQFIGQAADDLAPFAFRCTFLVGSLSAGDGLINNLDLLK